MLVMQKETMHMIVSIRVNIRYKFPEVLAASGMKPPEFTDSRKGGTGEPVLVKYVRIGKTVCRCARTYGRH